MLDIWQQLVGATSNGELEYTAMCVFVILVTTFLFKLVLAFINKF